MIYHILSQGDWSTAQAVQLYSPISLKREGFIPCCTESLFSHIANFYFKGRSDLVLLEIDENLLASTVRWDAQGEFKFPYIYGPVELSAVTRFADIRVNEDGLFEFPFKKVLH